MLILLLQGAPRLQASYNPLLLSTWPGTNAANTFQAEIRSNFVFLAQAENGLQVLDVSDPKKPTRIGGYESTGETGSIVLRSNRLYLGEAGSGSSQGDGLVILDVSNPAKPSRLGNYNTPGESIGIAVSGNYAYIGDGTAGLRVLDVSNPTHPSLVSTLDTSGHASCLSIAGNLVFLGDYDAGLKIIDITNPLKPALVGSTNTGGSAWHAAVSGDYVFVSELSKGLAVYQWRKSVVIQIDKGSLARMANRLFAFDFTAVPGTVVAIEYSTNLVDWLPACSGAGYSSDSWTTPLIDPDAFDAIRFYRLRYVR